MPLLFALLVILILLAGFVYQMVHYWRAKQPIAIPPELPSQGFTVPVIRAGYGYKVGTEPLNQSGNGFNANLVLFENAFKFNSLTSYTRAYSDIKNVGYAEIPYGSQIGTNLILTFKDETKNYYCYAPQATLKALLSFFQKKNCQLTDKAASLVST